ncbi:MAG TPA: pilus assembly protein TadG-related protein [Sphingomonadales bacterium]|nr:pilus assembly protein TadG-related protein [Sphingomonadales bacterium]
MLLFIGRLLREVEGAVLAYTAVLLPIFIGFVALGLDIAVWHLDKRRTQTIADAAAWAAAIERDRYMGNNDLTEEEINALAITSAGLVASRNGFRPVTDTLDLNIPPESGAFVGDDRGIEVIVRRPLPIFLSFLINESEKTAASRAVATNLTTGPACVFALNDELDGTITLNGNSVVKLNCGVFSNSAGDFGIEENGNPCLWATSIEVVGGSSPGCYKDEIGEVMEPTEGVAHRADPLSNLPEPEVGGCDFTSEVSFSGQTGGTLQPGVYCGGLSINTDQQVTFAPGMYIFNSGNISINGNANVSGTGITLYFADAGANTTRITVNGGANVGLQAPTSGTYQGILIFESRDAPGGTQRFNGGASMDLEGIIYTPNAHLEFAGTNDADSNGTALLADTIKFTGDSQFVQLNQGSTSPTFSPFFDFGRVALVE